MAKNCFEFVLCALPDIGLFQEKTKTGNGGWGHGISRGIAEIECGIYRVN